jgi:glycosyltransferase involved in cell wall biosynthesis
MASGTPVVTSRDGALAELTGGAAVLVDPRDVDAIAAGIEEAAQRREELRAAGLERAGAFTWEAAAKATAEVYREGAEE